MEAAPHRGAVTAAEQEPAAPLDIKKIARRALMRTYLHANDATRQRLDRLIALVNAVRRDGHARCRGRQKRVLYLLQQSGLIGFFSFA
jgi:hypothetical protein